MSANERLFKEARRHLVGGVNSPVRAFKAVGGAPPFIVKAKGPYVWDAAGRKYLEYIAGWGPHMLGHSYPKIVAAARGALAKGTSYGLPTEIEFRLAEVIKDALPSIELIRFVNSGTEATMSALRLARGVTNRDLILKFDGCYHGHADGLLASAGSGLATFGISTSPGVPDAFARLTLTIPYNDLPALHAVFKKQGLKLAAVIVEPVVGNMGVIEPLPGFHETLRELTRKSGTILIWDEVMTGFRVAWGGAQRLYDITPDLTCLGKIIGGGFPAAAYGGRKDLMNQLAPEGKVYQAGTLSGNPVAMAAGLAALTELKKRDYGALKDATAELCRGIRSAARAKGVVISVGEAPGMFTVFFATGLVTNAAAARRADTRAYARFFNRLRADGILFPPSQFEAGFPGFAHTPADISRTIAGCRF